MPAFPSGRPAPGYPRVGGSAEPVRDGDLDAVTVGAVLVRAAGPRGCLGVSPADGGRLARLLLDRLARDGVLTTVTSQGGATVYAIPPAGVVGRADPARRRSPPGGTCSPATPAGRGTGQPRPRSTSSTARRACWSAAAAGCAASALADNFYRRLYASTGHAPDRRARAHQPARRRDPAARTRTGSRAPRTDPDAPNVLVATPTLEMGIDIGDLSAVMLASLPRTVASYLQRVGRAGRLTGNALNLAFVTGRGEQLPKLGDPLSVINGAGPAARHLPARRGDPAPAVHRSPRRLLRPRRTPAAPAAAPQAHRVQRAGQLPRRR